mgnify:CR=1 FL=1|jgi:hypothetical protein|tara:strand:+ start:369 stop:602 length:234 start_codon:yes stop_codon:yes gene_type:complete
MGLLEGFTNVVVQEHSEGEKQKLYSMMFMVILIKVALIYAVSAFLWPKVMPIILPTVNANPGFMNILGLSIIMGIIL